MVCPSNASFAQNLPTPWIKTHQTWKKKKKSIVLLCIIRQLADSWNKSLYNWNLITATSLSWSCLLIDIIYGTFVSVDEARDILSLLLFCIFRQNLFTAAEKNNHIWICDDVKWKRRGLEKFYKYKEGSRWQTELMLLPFNHQKWRWKVCQLLVYWSSFPWACRPVSIIQFIFSSLLSVYFYIFF